MSKNVVVEVGARGIRPIVPSTLVNEIIDGPLSGQLIQQAQDGEGELFRNTSKPNDWIIVRNIPALLNNNQEIMREATRIDIKFEDGLYLLRHDDEHRELKLKKLKSLPAYGLTIRPMAEVSRENKAKAQAEAIKTLTMLAEGDGLRELIMKLAPKLEQLGVVKDTVDAVLNSINTQDAVVGA